MAFSLEYSLLQLERIRGLGGEVPTKADLHVVGPFGGQVSAPNSPAYGVVEVREGGVPYGSVGRRKQNGRTVAQDIHGQFRARNKPRTKHGVVVPGRSGRQRKCP